MSVLTSGLPIVLVIAELGVIIFLLLKQRELSREAECLNRDVTDWSSLALELDEQLQTMRRIYQGTQIKPIEPPMRRAERSD